MAAHDLNALETRILGALLEKEKVTPENYPLSLHSLTAACNQLTNREPISSYDEKTVEEGVNALRTRKLATVVFGAASRVQKYRHNLLDHYELTAGEIALLGVLLLRGAQTPGELRTRSERWHRFSSLEEVESRLDELSRGDAALVRALPSRAGQKERRYVQLLSHESHAAEQIASADAGFAHHKESRVATSSATERLEILEKEVANLREEVRQLSTSLTDFRKQFE